MSSSGKVITGLLPAGGANGDALIFGAGAAGWSNPGTAAQVLFGGNPPAFAAAPGVSWPLTNGADETFQPNGIANNALTLHNPVGANTGITIAGGQGGGAPGIQSLNSDIQLMPGSGGTATVALQLRVGGLVNPNYLKILTANSGGNPSIGSVGSVDANVDLGLNTVGAGVINFGYAVTALGGGAAPTLGTIGGAGPAAAAQNSWLAIKINGTASFLPVWR